MSIAVHVQVMTTPAPPSSPPTNTPPPPGTIRFNERVLAQFQQFYARPDTFSLGICNGCQLMALLGWVPAAGAGDATLPDLQQPRCAPRIPGTCLM